MLIDSHCHIASCEFSNDLPDIIDRAKSSGITTVLSVCTKISDYPQMLSISREYKDIFNTVGIHPSEIREYTDALNEQAILDWIEDCAQDPKTVAVGEIGLDYSYDGIDHMLQQELFTLQAKAGISAGLPLVIHTRDAEEDTIKILKSIGAASGVIHCFAGSEWLMQQALDLGFYISFSGIITFKKSDALRELVKKTPMDRILAETDAPYLAPEPMRGKRNEPSYVKYIAEKIAELKCMSLQDLAIQIHKNFFTLFTKAQCLSD
jgi:TatD DNase family protein